MIDWLNEVTSSGVFRALGLFALAFLVLLFILGQVKPGKAEPTSPEQKPWMHRLGIAGWVLIPLFAVLFVASLIQIAVMWSHPPASTDALALRVHYLAIVGFIGVLGGILAALAAYIRIFTTERQTTAQEQGLITDRINKAVENLGATRTVKRQRRRKTGALAYAPGEAGEPDYSQPIFEEVTEPNLEVRIGGIYALERIARDNLDYHIQIMEILTAYVRENAKATDAEDFPEPDWEPLPVNPSQAEIDAHKAASIERFGGQYFEDHSVAFFHTKAKKWANELTIKSDIQAALSVIGRRSPRQIAQEKADTRQRKEGYQLDLRKTNLQGADISDQEFSGAKLQGARLEGAQMHGTRLAETNLIEARLEGASLSGARMEGAHLSNARLEGAYLFGARLDGANLSRARLNAAYLFGARMKRVDLRKAQLERADLRQVRLGGADLSGSGFLGTDDIGARMVGADLKGAALKSTDLTDVQISAEQVRSTFGDASVILPDTLPRPIHWPDVDFHDSEFLEEWNRWRFDPDN